MTPQPFYTVEDVRSVGAGVVTAPPSGSFAMDGTLKKK